MAKSVRIVTNVPGYNAYRNSPEVVALLQDLADGIGERASAAARSYGDAHGITPPPNGEDVRVRVTHGSTRARATVGMSSVRARLAEAKQRALLKALGGGA